MAIAPISSVSFRNNYNQVNFEGKKKDKTSGLHVSSSIKAIPLATLIALSPLNNVEADAQVRAASAKPRTEVVQGIENPNLIKAERLHNVVKDPTGKEPDDLVIQFYDRDGNKSTTEEIFLFSKITKKYALMYPELEMGRYDINSAVKGINNFKLKIVGDDGKLMGTYTQSQVEMQDLGSLSNPDIVGYITDFLSSDKNNTNIAVRNVSNTLLPAGNFGLSARKKLDTSWIEKAKQNDNYNWGEVVKSGQVSTQQGDYYFTFHSSDKNPDDVEAIVVRRSDGLRFKLEGLKELIIHNETNDGYQDSFAVGCINISWPNVGKFTIFDNELYNFLFEMARDKNLGKSISITSSERTIELLSDGNVMKIENGEDKIIK